jgi:hypothetical protein
MTTKGGDKSEIESLEGVDVFAEHGMWMSEGQHRKLWYRQEEFLIIGSVDCANDHEHYKICGHTLRQNQCGPMPIAARPARWPLPPEGV